VSIVRALLMTDVVDSTGISDRLGAVAAGSLWRRHDDRARELIHRWKGFEVDKTDGFFILFESAVQAAQFAIEYHETIGSLGEPVKARVAIHDAVVDLLEDEDDTGSKGAKPVHVDSWLDKAIVARLLSITPGGLTLLTASAAKDLASCGLSTEPRGHWRFQGLAEPVEVQQLVDVDRATDPLVDAGKAYRVTFCNGMWVPTREIRHSIPAERDEFVGRTTLLRALSNQFRDHTRLVTLLGFGGVGKTRVAQRFAWQWLGDFPGGSWFCDLSGASTRDGITYAVAQGLELALNSDQVVEQIGKSIASRHQCLVVLDNFEQIVSHAEATVGRWLAMAPEARFLVTSRESLGIAGETVLHVEPLSHEASIALFHRRAVDAGDEAGSDSRRNDEVVGMLVDVLEGLPLAIELAAARICVMSPMRMLDRLRDRFRFLKSTRGRHSRQATLLATLDWSWDLLTDDERCALAELSVFEASFRLEDAEAILSVTNSQPALEALDLVQSLISKSLLRRHSMQRFVLLRTVREYAAKQFQLRAAYSEHVESVLTRYRVHFSGFDEQAATAEKGAAIDDLVNACRSAMSRGEAARATGALAAAWHVLRLTGPYRLVLELAAQVAQQYSIGDEHRSVAVRIRGSAQEVLGDKQSARISFEEAISAARAALDPEAEAWASCSMGEHLYKSGNAATARGLLESARDAGRALGKQSLECAAWNAIGTMEHRLGRAEAARASYTAALLIARAIGDLGREGGLLGNLAMLAHDAGQVGDAKRDYEQALTLARQVNNRNWEGNTHCNLGLLLQELGETGAAERHFETALAISREVGHRLLEATVSSNLGLACSIRRDWVAATTHHEWAVAIAEELHDRRAEGQFRGHLAECLSSARQSTEAMLQWSLAETALREVGDQISLCKLLCQRATAQCSEGKLQEARSALGEVRSVTGMTPSPELLRAISTLTATITAHE